MGFSGWSPAAVEFFQDLEADNTKAYWSAHKDLYEASEGGSVPSLRILAVSDREDMRGEQRPLT